MISFAMTEEQESAREAMRAFAADAMRPLARDYDEATTAHARDKGKVKAEAEAAKKAVDGAEGDDLRAAEEEGKSHARK